MHEFPDLYRQLFPEALSALHRNVPMLSAYDKEMLATDYTVDFYYSRSFRRTYDRTRDVLPFFRSWMFQRCKKAKHDFIKRSKMISLDKVAFMCGFSRDLSVELFELEDRLRSQYRFLKFKQYVTVRGEIISLQDAFMAWLHCLTEHGTVSLDVIGDELEVGENKRNITKGVLARMRKLLKEWDTCNTAY